MQNIQYRFQVADAEECIEFLRHKWTDEFPMCKQWGVTKMYSDEVEVSVHPTQIPILADLFMWFFENGYDVLHPIEREDANGQWIDVNC